MSTERGEAAGGFELPIVLKLQGFKDPSLEMFFPGAARVAQEAIDEIKQLHAALERPTGPAPPVAEGYAAALKGSGLAAQKWSAEERAMVRLAIRGIALNQPTFTADDVWDTLPKDFPVTKGLTAVLQEAARLKWIASTEETVITGRGGEHDHAQRLTVWESRLF